MTDRLWNYLLGLAYGLGFYAVIGSLIGGLSWLLYQGGKWLLETTGLTIAFENLFWAFVGIALLHMVITHLQKTGKGLREWWILTTKSKE